MRPKLQDIPVMIMIGLAIPLLFALRWLAAECPNWDERSRMIWANDAHVMWSRSAANPFITINSVDKGRVLLDIQSGRFSRLPLPPRLPTRGIPQPPINETTQDGRLVWTTEHDNSEAHVTDFESLKTQSFTIPSLAEQQLLGGRYFMEFSSGRTKYIDLQEPQPITHTIDTFAPFYLARKIPDHPHFYCIRPKGYDLQSKSPGNDAARTKPDSAPPISSTLLSNPSGNETCSLVLVRMTGKGPEEIAHWPVNWIWGNPEVDVKADGPYVFCRALNRRALHVHDANNGEIIAKIDLTDQPNFETLTRWQANRHSIRIAEAIDAYDPATGQKLPPALAQKEILDRKGDHYLTLPHDPAPNAKRPDCVLQVCKYPTGEPLATLAHPALNVYPSELPASKSIRLSSDGQQVIVCTQDERTFVLDARTGNIIRTFAASPWRYLCILAVVMAAVAWLAAWWRVGTARRIPRLILLLVASTLVLTFLLMRCRLNGHPYPPGRPAFQVGVALMIAWHTEVMQFLFRPGVSVIVRGLALGCFFIVLACFYCEGLSLESIFLFWIAITLSSSGFFLRQRLVGKLPALNGIENPKSKFSIGELLLLTTVLAFLTSAFIPMDWAALLVDRSATTENLLTFASLGIAANLFRVWWWLRLGSICVCAVVVALIAVTQYPDIPGHYDFLWLLSTLLMPLALFSYFQVAKRAPHRLSLLGPSSHPHLAKD